MIGRYSSLTVALSAFVVWSAVPIVAAMAQEAPRYPGPTDDGFLLPNGWTLKPAGLHIPVPDLPLNIIALADNRHVLASTAGYNAHELSLIDLDTRKVVDRQAVSQSWFGLATNAKGDQIWLSGGGSRLLHEFRLNELHLTRVGDAKPESRPDRPREPSHFRAGIAFDPTHNLLYSLDIDGGSISVVDVSLQKELKFASAGKRPYDVVLGRAGNQLFVSDWAGRAVLVLDPVDLRTITRIAVGEHPNQIAASPTDDRIFVACASSNWVSVIDTRRGVVTETIHTALFPLAPEGSTPDGLAIAPDGKTLFVANADNNSIAVIDIAAPNRSQVKGFIPTGWYPTAVAVTPDGKRLLVGVGKGNQTRPNAIGISKAAEQSKAGAASARPARPFQYIGTTLSGSLSIVPVPDDQALALYTETVYKSCPYSDKLLSGAPYPEKTAIPTRVGDPSPIKYVLYIIKENRTYDQVFGDLTKGNGDPSLVMFGRDVTPNHHKLAEEFVLLDNLYCNGHVSADGHPWSTMAYNTDYIARNWALTYSGRAGIHDDDDGDLANAPSGYLWDACARAGLSYRSYGEYGRRVSQPDGSFKIDGAVPGLVGNMSSLISVLSKAERRPYPRPGLRRHLHPGIPGFRAQQHAPEIHGHEPGRRPHDRHSSRHVYAQSLRGL